MKKLKGKLKDRKKRSSSRTINLGKIFDKHIEFEFKDKAVYTC